MEYNDTDTHNDLKGQGHQATLGGCSSHHLQGAGHIVVAALQAAAEAGHGGQPVIILVYCICPFFVLLFGVIKNVCMYVCINISNETP